MILFCPKQGSRIIVISKPLRNSVKTFILALFIGLIAIGTYLFYSIQPSALSPDETSQEKFANLPWQITVDAVGESTVFGLTPEVSTLANAENRFQQQSEIRLFRNANGQQSVEAYFDKVTLDHLIARIILSLKVDPVLVQQIEQSTRNHTPTPSGAYEIKITETALMSTLADAIISAITYSPVYLRLDEAMIQARFGKPEKYIESTDGNTHFLYPPKGLDIIRTPKGKVLLQYMSPGSFHSMTQALLETPVQGQVISK